MLLPDVKLDIKNYLRDTVDMDLVTSQLRNVLVLLTFCLGDKTILTWISWMYTKCKLTVSIVGSRQQFSLKFLNTAPIWQLLRLTSSHEPLNTYFTQFGPIQLELNKMWGQGFIPEPCTWDKSSPCRTRLRHTPHRRCACSEVSWDPEDYRGKWDTSCHWP